MRGSAGLLAHSQNTYRRSYSLALAFGEAVEIAHPRLPLALRILRGGHGRCSGGSRCCCCMVCCSGWRRATRRKNTGRQLATVQRAQNGPSGLPLDTFARWTEGWRRQWRPSEGLGYKPLIHAPKGCLRNEPSAAAFPKLGALRTIFHAQECQGHDCFVQEFPS